MDADAARLATAPEVLSLVDSIGAYHAADPLSQSQRLRAQGLDAATVAAVLTQARLRQSAVTKFGEQAHRMAFTQDGVEQATRREVAALHAQRFADAGITSVADLTCGIGADAMAMASHGLEVTAFDKDEATAIIAAFNLRPWSNAHVHCADAMAAAAAGTIDAEGIFADPARRAGGNRRHDPRDYLPPLDDILALRTRHTAVGIKVGPALDHTAIPAGVEAQWVSVDGAVVEAGLWSGPLARRAGHSALVIAHGEVHVLDADPIPGEVGSLGTYVMEPDGAVIRAGLVGPLAERLNAHLVAPSIAYLTADAVLPTTFARAYRVLEVLPLKPKTIAAALRARGVGTVTIKKRGVDITPEALRPQLKLAGPEQATVILTRIGTQRRALLVEPVDR